MVDEDLHWTMRLRKRLLIPGEWKWNGWVREATAWLEYQSSYSMRERRLRLIEAAWRKAGHRVPTKLKYWVIINQAAAYSSKHPKKIVPEITWSDMAKLLDGTDFDDVDMLDLCESAWGIIANAHYGNWDEADPEWKAAAERWRDKWHRLLDQLPKPIRIEEEAA